MKRYAMLLLAAALALGATGCQATPRDGQAGLGDYSSIQTKQHSIPGDCRIEAKTLTDAEKQIVDFVTTDSISMTSFRANPAWVNVEFWVEPYIRGERQPDIGMGGMVFLPGDPVEGDIMLKVKGTSMESYDTEIALKSTTSMIRLNGNIPIPVDNANAHAYWQLEKPFEIRENEGITLRVDSYGDDGVIGPIAEDGEVMDEILQKTAYVLVLKCRFSSEPLT